MYNSEKEGRRRIRDDIYINEAMPMTWALKPRVSTSLIVTQM